MDKIHPSRLLLFAAGILFTGASVYILVYDIVTYIQQFGQMDWEVTDATVTQVVERRQSAGGLHSARRSHTVYDLYYQYAVDGTTYTNAIYGLNAGKQDGETLAIKYDPAAPQNATHDLQPNFGYVVSGALGFIVFGAVGLRMAQSALPMRKRKRHSAP
jgi:hypothetical protein